MIPFLGHFTQADIIVPEPGKVSAFDRYAYVQNNPLRFNDPSGHDVGCAGRDCSYLRKNEKRSVPTHTSTPPSKPTPTLKIQSVPTPEVTGTITPQTPNMLTPSASPTLSPTPSVQLTTEMDDLQTQLLFYEKIGIPLNDLVEMMDLLFEKANRLSDLPGYKITKGVSASGIFEAVIAFGSEGYKVKGRTDIKIGQKAARMIFMGAEAYEVDAVSTLFGSSMIIPGVAMVPEAPVVGAALAYGVGSTASSVIIEDWLNRTIYPYLFPRIGLGEY